MSYDLSDNVNEDFSFSIGGIEYRMKYPLVEEIEEMERLSKAPDNETEEQKKAREQKGTEYLYSFISPKDPTSPSIEEKLKTQNIKVLQNFNQMIRTEFGIKQ